jgi:electron transfer flavoprotein beta subunit
LAEKLGLPQITYVEQVLDVADGKVVARCQIEGGHEVVQAPLPLAMTVVASANSPRPLGARRLAIYKKAKTRSELVATHGGRDYEDANVLAAEEEAMRRKGLWIHEWNADDLGAEPNRIGMAGSPTKVKQIESVVLVGGDSKDIPPTDEGIRGLVHELIEDHILS